jgi:serine/threonine protein kinase
MAQPYEGTATPIQEGAGGNLGVLLVRKGYTLPERVQECLRLQGDFIRQGRAAPRLGELLVSKGYVTADQVTEALAEQKQEIRSCTRCGIQVNVPLRDDAVDYRCGCGGELKEPHVHGRLAVSDAPIMILSDEPLPAEVEEARKDPANLFGKYVLLRELGRGGVGVVHLAWDTYLCQHVALKRVRADVMPDVERGASWHLGSLIKEARHAIKLRHPAIVTVFEAGCIDQQIYVSMEYLEGRTLEQEITLSRALGRLTPYHENPARVRTLLVEAARALHYAHSRPAPIIHCDLKPGNLLVDREDRIHILDFGLARNLQAKGAPPEDICGTPEYMAPEQVRGEFNRFGPSTDVYGFGAVLYELLCGSPPFEGRPVSILEQVMCLTPRPPGELLAALRGSEGRTLPPALENLCMRSLEKDPARRPSSMVEVAEVLAKE